MMACAPGRSSGKSPISVLLITVDTLRADRVGAYGDAAARTPAIDGLARGGVVFENAYTPVPITLPAHVSLMTGLVPPAHGVRGNGSYALDGTIPTLAEDFKSAGRATAAFVAAFPLARRFGLSRGFDVYDDAVTKAPGINYDLAERRAAEVVESTSRWLSRTTGAVFLWVHLFDPHAPYDPPPGLRTGDAYRDEVAAADLGLAELLREWDSRPGESVVALTSDHGEAFGEHGEWSHSLFVYDTTLHVPLIIRGGGLPKGARVAARVGIVDVASTLLELAGVRGRTSGTSLGSTMARPLDRPLYAETLAPRDDFGWSELRSWRDGGFKWIRAPQAELFDLASDPAEEKNLFAASPMKGEALEKALLDALARSGERERTATPDTGTKEALRSLGYIQGPGGKGSGADPKTKVALARRIAEASGPFADANAAVRIYRELVRDDPANPLLNLRLGDALLRAGKAKEAITPFRRVIASGPRTVDAHVGCATAYAQLSRLEEAKSVLDAALRIDELNGQVRYNLGEIARVRGRLQEARAHYEVAALDPVTASRARERVAHLR